MPTLSSAYLVFKRLFLFNRGHAVKNTTSRHEQIDNTDTEKKETLPGKLKRYFFSLFLTLPDAERNWIIPAFFTGYKIIKSNKIDCILTSCPPYSSHLVGLLLHVLTGVQWVADFRDPWSTASQKRLYYTCKLSKRIEGWMEKQVLKQADLVLVNTNRLKTALESKYSDLLHKKFLYVPNGFDKDLFSELSHVEKYQKFTISYLGGFYFGRSPEPLFKALKELYVNGMIQLSSISIKLYGNCDTVEGVPTLQLAHQYGLREVVKVMPFVPYIEALRIIKKSHVALLLAPDQPFQIPAKTYDYLGAGTRILALADDGATADLIQETDAGKACSPSDIEGIKLLLTREISDMGNEKVADSTKLADYERQVIVQKVAKALVTASTAS